MVLLAVALLVGLPTAVRAFPVPQPPTTAVALLARIAASRTVPYSGYAESSGGLALPVSGQFGSLSDLLGGRTELRVWWRSPVQWRVDQLGATGENGVHRLPTGSWQWDYEDNRATIVSGVGQSRVRLPVVGDLLPSELGRRLLGEALPSEVTRLAARRIAGRVASGVRLRPSSLQSSIGRVDVWADSATGIPLEVAVFGRGAGLPAMSTTFLDFSSVVPSAADIRFVPPLDARISESRRLNLVSAIDEVQGESPPAVLAGLRRSDLSLGEGAIGVYGHGVTQLVAAQLPDQTAGAIRRQLGPALGVTEPDAELSTAIGPLSLLVSTPDRLGRTWLLAGTVTLDTLAAAARELPRTAAGR